jgi:hypothetical protein
MPSKVSIIEVDLGATVEDIVAEEIQSLTGESAAQLDQAIETAKITEKVRLEKEAAVTEATTKLQTAMDAAYDQLIAAIPNGLPVSSVMAIVEGVVPNSSAFTLRMKHTLSKKGNPYFLDRIKRHGTPHYVFMPYNQEPTQQ